MNIKYLIFGVVYIIGMRLFRYWLDHRRPTNKGRRTPDNIIIQPKCYLVIGILSIVFWTVIVLMVFFLPENKIANYEEGMRLPYALLFSTFLLVPSIFLTMYMANWKIEIQEDRFTYRNMWRVKKTYLYDDVTVKQLSRCTRFYYHKKHIVGISFLQDNCLALEDAIMSYQYKKSKAKKSNEHIVANE